MYNYIGMQILERIGKLQSVCLLLSPKKLPALISYLITEHAGVPQPVIRDYESSKLIVTMRAGCVTQTRAGTCCSRRAHNTDCVGWDEVVAATRAVDTQVFAAWVHVLVELTRAHRDR